jgi:prolyl-tRNA synthetase
MDPVIQSLASISIKHTGIVAHQATTSPATWSEALKAQTSTPKDFVLLKTLVFKPKTAKSAVPIPVVVIARNDAEINSSVLAKKLNLKELRLASEELLSEFFSLDKDSRMFFLYIIDRDRH